MSADHSMARYNLPRLRAAGHGVNSGHSQPTHAGSSRSRDDRPAGQLVIARGEPWSGRTGENDERGRAARRLTRDLHALLTADDLAERWQVSKAHVYRLAREGDLPTVRLGRYRRFRIDQVECWERRMDSDPGAV